MLAIIGEILRVLSNKIHTATIAFLGLQNFVMCSKVDNHLQENTIRIN